jgi:hypothetical protein
MKFIVYQPGNGTRYDVFMEKIEDPNMAYEMNISPGGWFVGLLNIRNARCYAFQSDGYLDVGYVESHLFKGKGEDWEDAKAITQLLGQVMQRKIKDPWKQCKSCGLPIHPGQNEIGLCVGCEYRQKRR